MSQSISKLVDALPTNSMTVYMLRSLDFIVPGEWQNVVGFENTIRAVTGVTDKNLIEEIGERAIALFDDSTEVYQQTLWLYQAIDRADSAIGAAALANKVGEKISFLNFLNQLTPKPDTVQAIDLSLKLVVELIAFCRLHGIPTSIEAFRASLANYHNESIMRMAALVAVDGLIPLGPDFILKAQSIIAQVKTSQLEGNTTYQSISSAIPGGTTAGKLGFIGESFASVNGWMSNFVASHGLTPENVVTHLQQFMNTADSKLDYLAAFLDMSTNYYEHTGTQTVARNLILRAAESRKKAAILEAEGTVKSIELLTKALQTQPLSREVLQFIVAQRYVDASQQLSASPNSKIVFMDPKALNQAMADLMAQQTDTPNGKTSEGTPPK